MTRLYRSETNKKLAGICGGISEMKDIDPSIVRLVVVTLALVTGVFPCVIAYLIAWWVIPTQREIASHPS
jgi:phage shock protein C